MDYTSIIVLGFPFAMIATAFSNIIRADGSPRYSMVATLAGAALNTVLDPIFIFVLGMEVKGAAIATVISQIVSAALILDYVLRRGRILSFSFKLLKPDLSVVKKQLTYGSASFVTQMAIIVVNVVSNNFLTYYGANSPYGSDIPLAAMGIIMKIAAILISCILGIAIGAQPILGFNYGARNYSRVRRTYKAEITASLTLSGVMCLLFVTVPHIFVSVFGDSNPTFNEFTARAMRSALCFIVCAGFQIPSANYFQAVGKPMKSMTLTMTRSLFCQITFLLVLPLFFGLDGILLATPATDITSTIVTTIFIIREQRSLKYINAIPTANM
jgi:putative MATE family efflux protein